MEYSFKKFQKECMIRLLGLEKYKYIMENLYKCDISIDKESKNDFKNNFNSLYQVRRNDDW